MKLNYDFEIIDIGGELTMVPIDVSGFHAVLRLNEVSADIIKLMKEDISEDEIVNEMKKMYDASEEDIKRNVTKVIEHLRSEKLLTK